MTGPKSSIISLFIIILFILSFASITSCKSEDTTEISEEPAETVTTIKTVLPLTRVSTDDFTGSGNCANCHTDLSDSAGNDVSIGSHWRSTMMANAAKDPIWQAKVASEVSRTPGLKEVIEDKCTTCHMPMAYTQANTDGTPASILDDGFLNPSNALHDLAMDGNSCTLCHQIVDPVLGTYTIDTSTDPPDRINYGPFTNPQKMAMRTSSGFTPVFGEQTLESTLCGTCHWVTTPYVGNEGNVLGTFPEQTPCLEHQNSIFVDQGVECQTCHMPEASTPVVIATMPRNLSPREPFVQHYFVGGNKIILDILNENSEELGVTASDAHFRETITNLLELLQNETAEITLPKAEVNGDQITVMVNIDQIVGHKFPTGFPSRRAWIHLTVTDKNSSVIFESGDYDKEGRIIGCDADYDAATLEPHYNTISQEDQVQIYESVMQDFEGNVTYTLLKGAAYAKDNRLLPPGFDIENAGEKIAVYGKAAQDSNFIAGSDRIEYRIDTSGKSGPYTIEVELLYQTISYRFVQDLLIDDDEELVDTFESLYSKVDKSPILISSARQTVQ